MTIKKLRKQIDAIDHQIIDLLAQRMKLVKDIGGLKRAEGKDPLDEARFRQVIMDRIVHASKAGVSARLIQSIWSAIHHHALKIEKVDE